MGGGVAGSQAANVSCTVSCTTETYVHVHETYFTFMLSLTVVDCRDLNAVMNGDLIYSTGTTYTSVAEITCHEGYELIGSSVRVCQDNGEWAGAAPICRGTQQSNSES